MRTFAILDSDIIRSTIWTEDDCTRIVWITMLALKDADGFVRGCITTVAGIARQPVDKCTASLEKLEAPDPDSASPEHEGRRLLKVPGGWIVVNHHKYRDKERDKNRKEYLREYMREYMKKKRGLDNKSLTESNAGITSVSECECASSKEGDCKGGIRFPEFWKAWPAHPRKANKKACLKLWKAQALDNLADTIITAVEKFKLCEDWTKEDRQFIPAPLVWLRQERWEAAGYIGNRSGVEDTPEIIEYAKQVRQKVERENGRDIGRLYHKIRDAIGQQAFNRVKQLALEKGGRG